MKGPIVFTLICMIITLAGVTLIIDEKLGTYVGVNNFTILSIVKYRHSNIVKIKQEGRITSAWFGFSYRNDYYKTITTTCTNDAAYKLIVDGGYTMEALADLDIQVQDK